MKNSTMIPLLLIGVILIAGCTSTQPASNNPPSSTGSVKEFTIRESSFQLSPSMITVNKGDTVRITVVNDGGTHNLFIEGYSQRTNTLSTGNSATIEFVADQAGTFKMWCEVGSHRAQGMEGQLVVQ